MRKMKKILGTMTVSIVLSVSFPFLIQAKEEVTKDTFDYQQYADKYPDLKSTFGYDRDLLWNHYNQFGKEEGRFPGVTPASFLTVQNFDAKKYAALYPDIVASYGTSANALWAHYLEYGFREGREAFGLDDITTAKLAAWKIAHEIATVVSLDKFYSYLAERCVTLYLASKWIQIPISIAQKEKWSLPRIFKCCKQ